MTRVLVVEDDLDLGNLLKQYLELNQFQVSRAFNGEEARAELKSKEFDILILDVMMPKEDGFTLAKKLQTHYPQLPFLFVTAKKMKEDILMGLQLGADDYITKPFDADELILRIKNILKRNAKIQETSKQEIFSLGKFTFEPQNLLLKSAKSEKILTEKEAQLLLYLIQNKGKIIRREEVLGLLWEEVDFFSGRSLDVFISRLRKYLSEDPDLQIESIRGVGFRTNF